MLFFSNVCITFLDKTDTRFRSYAYLCTIEKKTNYLKTN